MTLTIRTLSEKAEENINRVIEENESINTKTKAIQHILERHEYYKEYVKTAEDERRAKWKAQEDLEELSSALRVISKYI